MPTVTTDFTVSMEQYEITNPVIQPLANNNFLVLWTRNNELVSSPDDLSVPHSQDILGRVFTSGGVPITDSFAVSDPKSQNEGYISNVAITKLADGDYAVAWFDNFDDGTSIGERSISADGTPFGAQQNLNGGSLGFSEPAEGLIVYPYSKAGSSIAYAISVHGGDGYYIDYYLGDHVESKSSGSSNNHVNAILAAHGNASSASPVLNDGDTVQLSISEDSSTQASALTGQIVHPAPATPTGATTVSPNASYTGSMSHDLFYFDTSTVHEYGRDTINNFGSGDVFVTTTPLFNPNTQGVVNADASDRFDLAGEGSVKLFNTNGKAISHVKLVDIEQHDGTSYFVYAANGDTTHFDGLHF